MAGEIVLVGNAKIVTELQKMKPQIEAALPRHITPDRMARIALTALRKTPKLYGCTLDSFFGAIIGASQLGLEPNVNGQCYIIPYGTEATLIPGWRGYMDLVSRTGRAMAETHAVYDGDEFHYEYGTRSTVFHRPGKWQDRPEALTHVYALGRIKGMEDYPVFEVWEKERIWSHRDRNNKCKTKSDHYSFAHPEMYARKIPLLQIIKYLPTSVEIMGASILDISGAEGRQHITIEGALGKNFDGGGDIGKDLEIDSLMEKLNWDQDKRDKVRESYASRTDELLDYLKKELAPLEHGKTQSAESKEKRTRTAAKKQDAEPAAQKQTKEPEPSQSNGGARNQPNLNF